MENGPPISAGDAIHDSLPGGVCERVWIGCTVHSSGKVFLCCLGCSGACSVGMVIGDLARQGLREILTGPAVFDLRHAHYGGDLSRACCGTCERYRPGPPDTAWPDDPLDLIRCIEIETTERCNLRCTMCLRTYQEMRGQPFHGGVERSSDMPFERFAAIVGEFADLNRHPKRVHMQWVGEPLLHSRVLEMFAEPLKYPGLMSQMVTNGLLLDDDLARRIVALEGPMLFEISLNAPDRDSYRAVMRVDGFETVVGNVKRFLALRQEAGRENDITVRIKLLAMPETAGKIVPFVEEMRAFATGIGARHAVWWNNIGRNEPVAICVNPLYADGFGESGDLLDLVRHGKGVLGTRSSVLLAQYLEMRCLATSFRETLTEAVQPFLRFLDAACPAETPPIVALVAAKLDLLAAAVACEPVGDVAALAGRYRRAVETTLAGIVPLDKKTWEYLWGGVTLTWYELGQSDLRLDESFIAEFDGAVKPLIESARAFPGVWDGEACLRGVHYYLVSTTGAIASPAHRAERLSRFMDALRGSVGTDGGSGHLPPLLEFDLLKFDFLAALEARRPGLELATLAGQYREAVARALALMGPLDRTTWVHLWGGVTHVWFELARTVERVGEELVSNFDSVVGALIECSSGLSGVWESEEVLRGVHYYLVSTTGAIANPTRRAERLARFMDALSRSDATRAGPYRLPPLLGFDLFKLDFLAAIETRRPGLELAALAGQFRDAVAGALSVMGPPDRRTWEHLWGGVTHVWFDLVKTAERVDEALVPDFDAMVRTLIECSRVVPGVWENEEVLRGVHYYLVTTTGRVTELAGRVARLGEFIDALRTAAGAGPGPGRLPPLLEFDLLKLYLLAALEARRPGLELAAPAGEYRDAVAGAVSAIVPLDRRTWEHLWGGVTHVWFDLVKTAERVDEELVTDFDEMVETLIESSRVVPAVWESEEVLRGVHYYLVSTTGAIANPTRRAERLARFMDALSRSDATRAGPYRLPPLLGFDLFKLDFLAAIETRRPGLELAALAGQFRDAVAGALSVMGPPDRRTWEHLWGGVTHVWFDLVKTAERVDEALVADFDAMVRTLIECSRVVPAVWESEEILRGVHYYLVTTTGRVTEPGGRVARLGKFIEALRTAAAGGGPGGLSARVELDLIQQDLFAALEVERPAREIAALAGQYSRAAERVLAEDKPPGREEWAHIWAGMTHAWNEIVKNGAPLDEEVLAEFDGALKPLLDRAGEIPGARDDEAFLRGLHYYLVSSGAAARGAPSFGRREGVVTSLEALSEVRAPARPAGAPARDTVGANEAFVGELERNILGRTARDAPGRPPDGSLRVFLWGLAARARAGALDRDGSGATARDVRHLAAALGGHEGPLAQLDRDRLLTFIVPIDAMARGRGDKGPLRRALDGVYYVLGMLAGPRGETPDGGLQWRNARRGAFPWFSQEDAPRLSLPAGFAAEQEVRVEVDGPFDALLYARTFQTPGTRRASDLRFRPLGLHAGRYRVRVTSGRNEGSLDLLVRTTQPAEVYGIARMAPRLSVTRAAGAPGLQPLKAGRDSLTVAMPLKLPVGLSRADVGIGVMRVGGPVLYGPNTAFLGAVLDGAPREGFLVFQEGEPRLLPGKYAVMGGVFDEYGERCYSFNYRLMEFEVTGRSAAEGLIDLGVDWLDE